MVVFGTGVADAEMLKNLVPQTLDTTAFDFVTFLAGIQKSGHSYVVQHTVGLGSVAFAALLTSGSLQKQHPLAAGCLNWKGGDFAAVRRTKLMSALLGSHGGPHCLSISKGTNGNTS